MTDKYTIHLVLNTHWDREWRWSIRETQMRLQEALDSLLDIMESDPRYTYFLADAQTAMIDDYLDARPENLPRIQKLVTDGRLFVGPWYTLPAQFMVSGESLVRNLLLGHKMAKGYGKVMKFAYTVFSWGHVSQLPQIYRQFGMDGAMFYRGLNKHDMDGLEFWWEAPDGSRLLGITFGWQHRINFWANVYRRYQTGNGRSSGLDRANGDNGYLVHFADPYDTEINGYVLNQGTVDDLDEATIGLNHVIGTLTPKSRTSHILLKQGFDLENPDPIIPDLMEQLNERIDVGQMKISNIVDYGTAVRHELEETGQLETLPVYRREMLDVEKVGAEYGSLFVGVYSARIPVKQANANSQIGLENWAEPAAVWTAMLGNEYPTRFLDAAWKLMMQSQQHDGIGGTHVDRVQLSTLERYREVDDISSLIARKSLRQIVADIDFSHLGETDAGLVIFNPLPNEEGGVFTTYIDIPEGFPDATYGAQYQRDSYVEITDAEGNKLPIQIISIEDRAVKAYLFYGSATGFDSRRFKVAFQPDSLPQLGYTSFTVKHIKAPFRPLDHIAKRSNQMANEHLHVAINGDGTLDITDKANDHTYKGLHYFEDEGDTGGPLGFMPPFVNQHLTTVGQQATVALLVDGPLQATYRISREWQLPAEIDAELRISPVQGGGRHTETGMTRRSARTTTVTITTDVTLRKGSRTLEFNTTINNTAKDHRLRVMFPTYLPAEQCTVDTPFDVVQRTIAVPDSTGWLEPALTTAPCSSFVDVAENGRGLSLFQIGTPEYEVIDDESRAIALTLLRCWPTAAGSETFTFQPLAQMPGEHSFQYALYIHEGDWQTGNVVQAAARYKVPVRIAQTTHHHGTLPAQRSFFKMGDEALVFSGLKQAENGDGFIFRCYNPTRTDIATTLTIGQPITRAEKVTLEELTESELAIENETAVPLAVRAGEIVSIRIFV